MKYIFGLIALLFLSYTNVFSQEKKSISTTTIKVDGNCNQCKQRIENAAYTTGVKRAEWDKTTKILTVSYNTKKTTIEKIADNIAKAGHDAANTKASTEAYKKLPECCAYKDVAPH